MIRRGENDFRRWIALAYVARSFDSVDLWQVQVQQDDIRAQFLTLANGFYSIGDFTDDFPFGMFQKQ